MNDYDFWKIGLINIKGLGYFPIFRVIAHDMEKVIYLSFKSFEEFHDFDYLDKWNRIRPTSELYKSVMIDINAGTMKFYHSKEAAINGMMLELYEKRKSAEDEQQYIETLFKELSMKYIKSM